jgi:hypothetical protein
VIVFTEDGGVKVVMPKPYHFPQWCKCGACRTTKARWLPVPPSTKAKE